MQVSWHHVLEDEASFMGKREHIYVKSPPPNASRYGDGMGISDLWPILSLLSDDRILFLVFLSRFIEQHGRPPRLAIDAYMFMFWSQLPGSDAHDPGMERIIIRNFMAKLWYLVQYNVLFVVVFDGKFKPGKLRNGHIPDLPETCSYDDSLHYFKKLHHSFYSEGLRLIDTVSSILSRNCMDWVQAPAEAEAECAWLQRLGVVDYVVSDDSDTLVFGASCVLRMFNRVKYYTEENEPVLSNTDYYVTPIYMHRITERTSLTRDHLVLIAVLRGGDYSSGSEGIGITRAKEIALCGTTVLLHLPRKKAQDFGAFPDVTHKFAQVFKETEKVIELLADPFYGLKAALDREEGLRAFNLFLNEFLVKEGTRVFGRMTNFKNKIKVDEFYALLYFFPFVNRRIFKFMPSSITFAEQQSVDTDLKMRSFSIKTPRINCILSLGVIGHLVYEGTSQKFLPSSAFKIPRMAMPRERKWSLKPLSLKLLRDSEFWEVIRLHRVKELDGVRMGVLAFNRARLNELVYSKKKLGYESHDEKDVLFINEPVADISGLAALKPEMDTEDVAAQKDSSVEENEDKLISFHVPLECIKFISAEYVNRYEESAAKRKSPRKKKTSPQKTTLDSIWPILLPKKAVAQLQNTLPKGPVPKLGLLKNMLLNPFLEKLRPGGEESDVKEKTEYLPSKKLPRRRRAPRNELVPGQSTLTAFFEKHEKIDRFHESLFVDADSGPSQPSKDEILSCPPLKYKTPRPLSPSSSVELSPTKQTRRHMRLSPDTSPVKASAMQSRDLK